MCIGLFLNVFTLDKTYVKKYYENGKLKAEGWVKHNKKDGYWFEYFENGRKKSQGWYEENIKNGYWYYFNLNNCKLISGNYTNGKKTGWWRFELQNGNTIKVQYKDNNKNGIALYYKKNKRLPYQAKRYIEGQYQGTWTDYNQFKKDNPDFKI